MREFFKISKEEWIKQTKDEALSYYTSIIPPQRQTSGSAGYDFYLPYDVIIFPNKTQKIYTGIKCSMEKDEVLQVYIRSSLAIKSDMEVKNQVGIIDHDYFNNADNEGHIIIALHNCGDQPFNGKAGDRVAQGIIMKYLTTDNDIPVTETRTGGIGSTTAK